MTTSGKIKATIGASALVLVVIFSLTKAHRAEVITSAAMVFIGGLRSLHTTKGDNEEYHFEVTFNTLPEMYLFSVGIILFLHCLIVMADHFWG